MSTIVLIEDHPQSARLAARLLQQAGHEVITAQDGEQGLEVLQDSLPHLILVDLGLPDMDGQTVVALLRQEEALAHVPVIAFTLSLIHI
jgi:CheY-like chemotaxis protein